MILPKVGALVGWVFGYTLSMIDGARMWQCCVAGACMAFGIFMFTGGFDDEQN